MHDDEPDTLHPCEACGDSGGVPTDPCPWCTRGFQDAKQLARWRRFRTLVRSISGTYALFESMLVELVTRLESRNTEEARKLADQGVELLQRWKMTPPGTDERAETAKQLADFNKLALTILTK